VTRVLVVGTGWWATRFHLPVLRDAPVELVGVCDARPSRAALVASRFGAAASFEDHRQALAVASPEAVVIATPHSSHYAIAADAIAAGCHVFVEKSLALRAADARELVAAAQRGGRHLVVGYTYQFASTAAFAREAVRTRIGTLLTVSGEFQSHAAGLYAAADDTAEPDEPETAHPSSYTKENGGGQAYTQLSHLVSLALWSSGARPQSVVAFTDDHGLRVDVDDAVLVRFVGGGLGAFTSTGAIPKGVPLRQTLSYVGTSGSVTHDLISGEVVVHLPDGSSLRRAPGQHEPPYPARRPMEAFVDLVTGRSSDNPGDPIAAADTVAVLEAVVPRS
jgi:predicted dehydrogenase